MESKAALALLAVLAFAVTTTLAASPTIDGPGSISLRFTEEEPQDTFVATVVGFDPDGDSFDFVIQNQVPAGYWQITTDGIQGRVTVLSPPNRETANIATFDIVIRDATMTDSDLVAVTVILTDINDQAPTCGTLPTINPLSESSPGGYVVTMPSSDADTGINAQLSFSILSPLDGTFVIGSLSGVITLARQLDFEDISHYDIMVQVEDNGFPVRLSTTCPVPIDVTDEVEQAPSFTSEVYFFLVAEGDYSSNSILVGDVSAIDPDPLHDPGSEIEYRKFSRSTGDPTDDLFSVTTVDTGGGFFRGEINAIAELDRESISEYVIFVEAVKIIGTDDLSSPDIAAVRITIGDENDNVPEFERSHYSVTLSELAAVGEVVISDIEAFDADLGNDAGIIYGISTPNVPFEINPLSGIISVSGSLDYDDGIQAYDLDITATETLAVSGTPPGSATVTIRLINENDNSPIFDPTTFTFSIDENQDPVIQVLSTTSPSPSITMIEASDADPGDFGDLRYSLVGVGVPSKFQVNSMTGEISTQSVLDVEGGDFPQYHLTLIAEDGAGALSNPNKGFALIIITVNDINDNPPVFNPNSYTITIPEDTENTNFLTLQATDADISPTDIQYSVVNDADETSVAPYFSIDINTGALSSGQIDYNTDFMSITLRVVAMDNGGVSPSQTGTATVEVMIQERNGATPMFSTPSYSVSIDESLSVGSPISLTVSATDPEDHPIHYYTDTSLHGAFFSVHETTGVLSLAHEVDYEDSSERAFSFNVLAVDQPPSAIGSPRTGTAVVTVTVNDVNDNAPVFSSPSGPLSITLLEEVTPNYILPIMASDVDGDSDGTVLDFALTQSAGSYFSLITANSELTQSLPLDRETYPTIVLTVIACDQGASPLCSSETITVTVSDNNDNPPVFVSTTYTSTTAECTPGGSSVGQVQAVDNLDTGDFAEVTYQITGGTDQSRFLVEPSTGVVRLSPDGVDYELSSTFTVTIGATDYPDGPLANQLSALVDTTFTLTATDCNDFPPVFQPTDSYDFAIPEHDSVVSTDTTVFNGVSTTDGDRSTANKNVRYELADGLSSTNQWFDIASNGDIFIRATFEVDREGNGVQINSAGEGVISFDILAINDDTLGPVDLRRDFTSTAMVTIRLTDINDNDPVFVDGDSTSVTVFEHSPMGTVLTILTATDADSDPVNTAIEYTITAGDTNLFSVNPLSGLLYVSGDLDEETMVEHILTVSAANNLASGGTPDTISVTVTVTDTNDHSPEFDFPQYTASVAEHDELLMTNVGMGFSLDIVQAIDLDGVDASGSIQYFISAGNPDDIFAVDPITGKVTVEKPELIDHETRTQYNLIIIATDTVLPITERRQNSTHFIVNVIDVNDNLPRLSSMTYTGFVTEEMPLGATVTVTPTIQASDADAGGMEPVDIEFSAGLPSIAFTITTDGSLILTTTSIDREINPTFTLTVRAQDQGSHEVFATLIVEVVDINDNPPLILETPSELAVTVPENFPVACAIFTNCVVENVTAVDIDTGPNAHFTFSMTGHLGYFEINQFTGEITLSQSLDREVIRSYEVTVTATDNDRNSDSETFTITVGNLNDNSPVFTAPSYVGNVLEGVLNGTFLSLRVNATDLDENSTIYYSKLPGPAVPFDVEPLTGRIFTTGPLDRESQGLYSFMVVADDRFLGTSSPQALVEVIISDVNDEVPEFEFPVYTNSINEGTPQNTIVFRVHADDGDIGPNAEIEYSILSAVADRGSATNYFDIDPTTGDITVLSDVDISATEPTNVNITVQARDLADPFNTDTTLVVFNIIDENTDTPVFSEVFYQLSVVENMINTAVGTVIATESSLDLGANAQITYFLPDTNSLFEVDPDHGIIRTLVALNREDQDLHTFRIAARDNAVMPRTGYATVTVTVDDVNDNPPVFNPSNYPIGISESTAMNSTVIRVLATDEDAGDNGRITFEIASGDTTTFMIDNTGLIRTKKALDRETTAVYILLVTATDMGDIGGGTPLHATANVTVFINDENDNNPMFLSEIGDIAFYEGIPIGSYLVTVNATDRDFQINGIIAYSFDNNSQVSGPFEIDRNSGVITTRSELDRETEDKYTLTVVIADQRGTGPNVRQASSTFTVTLLDINDNEPYLIRSSWNFEISEDQPPFLPFDRVQGNDDDVGENGRLFYHILDSNGDAVDCFMGFCIDSLSGELFTDGTGDADREVLDTFIIQVAVSNTPNLTFNGTGNPDPDVTSSLGTVQITVTDVNDNPPSFVASSLLAAVAEEAEFGTTVTVIEAIDPDLGDHGVVYFNIITGQVPYLIDRDTGVVTTAGVFSGLSGTVHQVEVRAFDNLGQPPSLASTAIMTVQIFKTTEQIIITLGTSLEIVEDKLDQIEAALVQLTSARILITEVRVKRTDDGTVDVTGTDIIFFALDPSTGDVIHPVEVIRRIDTNFASVADLFNDCKLESIRPHPSIGVPTVYPAWLWAIVGILAGIITLGCCCFFCLLVVERRRNKRLKKQNQLSAYQSQVDNFNAISNPLWVSPYDNWETASTEPSGTQVEEPNPLYESQELTIEMFQDDDIDSVGSQELLIKAPRPPPLSGHGLRGSAFSGADDDELLAEAIGERKYTDIDSETSLI